VLASVPVLDSAPPATAMHLEPAALDAYAGTYAMSSIASATLRRDGDRLMVQATNRGGMYLPTTSAVALVPVARDEFVLATPRAERVRFERDGAGRVAALVIAPGQWPIRAVRQR
jgi:hypothetical protein